MGSKPPSRVTLEMMILQGQAVMRGSQRALVVVDMPFGSYEDIAASRPSRSAVAGDEGDRLRRIKVEGGRRMAETINYPGRARRAGDGPCRPHPPGDQRAGRVQGPGARPRPTGRRSRRTPGRSPTPAPFPSSWKAMAEPLAAQMTAGGRDPDHRHRGQPGLRRPDPGHGGHAGPVAPGAEIC